MKLNLSLFLIKMFKGIRGDADGNSSRSGLANSLKKLILEQFSEKKILDFIASEIAKVMARTIGWLTLDFVLYGSQNWFSRRRKKREEAQEYLSGNCQRLEGGDKNPSFSFISVLVYSWTLFLFFDHPS